ncbi:MAG TPA: prepilin-type N-terminal cleavage/methylation domain-containing protein [Patescibacteria group bacterium]|nr:prepilin-type N-terminal cleavage/methylation domain-containing protein [Patescibacteria group bacterium]
MNKKNYNNKQGFTLLEIAVAVFVISLGIVGVLSLINYNLRTERVSKNELIAGQLAQEGLELVRNQRDNNWLERNDWKTDIIPSDSKDNNYTIDYSGGINEGVDKITNDKARLHLSEEGFYTHDSTSSSTPTKFYRLLSISEENKNSFTLECLVQWEDRMGVHNYKAETELYSWRR